MSEDYLEEGTDTGSENRRPFLILTGALVTIFVLAIICTAVVFAVRNRGNGDDEAVAIRLTENAETLAQNALVTQTVAAMETRKAQPTNTLSPTNTPEPSDTPAPTATDTPVIAVTEEELGTPIANGTNVFAQGGADSTPTAIAGLGGADHPDELPETGIDAWVGILMGLALIGVLFGARRLRAS